ncbi:MAG TPA: toll/interleukin-1 receptor domain-containing protein [Ktedonobacteraceae bacterium]|nr:toll/interleukin-1 receptor domain-containing protein [Ktedonobacteraceae bacterium]
MANPEHLEILKQGVKVWNQWREENTLIKPDLREANLSGAKLSEIHLGGADLSGANLSEANLWGANFFRAVLKGTKLARATLLTTTFIEAELTEADFSWATPSAANFNKANLQRANFFQATLDDASFTGANLSNANFSQSTLSYVNLSYTNLDNADLSDARTAFTDFGNVDLRSVKGLDTVSHYGPSTIGTNTLERSQGEISEAFLRGAGLSDTFITYARSLVGKAIEYYSCFISYSSKDDAFAKRLYADLQSNNVRCWFAPEDMKIGDEIRVRIDESIRIYDKLLVVLSENSVNSGWVEDEVEAALEKEWLARERGEKQVVLFPIQLDDAVKDIIAGWPAKIRRTRNIGDFRNWDKSHADYIKAFKRLLRDMKAET